jgi:hypothetical protein
VVDAATPRSTRLLLRGGLILLALAVIVGLSPVEPRPVTAAGSWPRAMYTYVRTR